MEIRDSYFEKISMLLMKNLLIKQSPKEVIDFLDSEVEFIGMVSIIEDIFYDDCDFFLLKDYLSKSQYFIRLGSEKFRTKGEVRAKENELIIHFNNLLTTNYHERIIRDYLDSETIMRGYLPYTDELLFESMANDYYIIKKVQDGDFDSLKSLPEDVVLSSLCYFTYYIPELYKNDFQYMESMKEYFNNVNKEKPKLKRYTNKIQKRLSIIKEA